MGMDQLGELIKDVGFPIAVAAWVLVRLNGKMDRLSDALHSLIDTLKDQSNRAILDHAEDRATMDRIKDEVTRRGSM